MTIEKVKQIAREKYGMDMTDEMTEKYIAKYSDKQGLLSDDELDNVSGGYNCTDKEFFYGKYCEPCGVWCDDNPDFDNMGGEIHFRSMKCPVCGTIYQ